MPPLSIQIEVTLDDIVKGVPKHCGKCPIALAVMRIAPPDATNIEVSDESVRIGFGEHLKQDVFRDDPLKDYFYFIPDEANDFIEAFDDGRPVQPFTFTAEAPDNDPYLD